MAKALEITAETVELESKDGVAFIEQASPLTRLHYFDGKFLRADALALEQDYHRYRTQLANIAGGWGAVHGLGILLHGNRLDLGAGLAITAAGNFVLATTDLHAQIDDLLKVAAPAPPQGSAEFADCPGAPAPGVTEIPAFAVYEITVGPIQGLCGNEPVYGKLCESACATDSRHPYWREGVVLRLRPIQLQLPTSSTVKAVLAHLRNRVASAYFRFEPWLTPNMVSGAGLASHVWCEPATLYSRDEVVIGLLVREGGINRVIDAWSGRRERMDTQPRGYWQGRMTMRPWNVFVAQILQFQCQLSGLFEVGRPVFEPDDDCAQLRDMLGKTRTGIEGLVKRYGESTKNILARQEGRPTIKEFKLVANDVAAHYADLEGISSKLAEITAGQGALPKQRMLLNAGFFELPPAGYLPVDPAIALEEQVQRMFGEGARLHFHAVRHDEIAHLVEEAQHMERISLTRGLDDPKDIEQVEIFVPDGEVRGEQAASVGTWWRLDMNVLALNLEILLEPDAKDRKVLTPRNAMEFDGLVRTEARENGTTGFAFAASLDTSTESGKVILERLGDSRQPAIYVSADLGADPFGLAEGDDTSVKGEIRMILENVSEMQVAGTLTMREKRALSSGQEECAVQLDLQISQNVSGSDPRSWMKRLRAKLTRKGDADSGTLAFEVDDSHAKDSIFLTNWDDSPRTAAMFFVTRPSATEPGKEPGAAAGDRTQVLRMTALAAMPEPNSTIGAASMNTLVALAEVTDDPVFLMRSRRRLFPLLDAPKTQTIRAVSDWVMFRRARTHLCGPACDKATRLGIAAFQVWHLKLANKEDLARLKDALDKGKEEVLAKFAFKRVGILRYRDDSTFSEETADRVVAMWTPIQPAPEIVLGRVWETAPDAGQGLQDQLRLRNMIDQIAALTKPAATSGLLAAIPSPSKSLEDGALDGGMLVVTMGEVVSRSALLIYGNYDSNQHFPSKNPKVSPQAEMTFENDAPVGDTLVAFTKGLNANQPVRGITVATTKGAPDAGATKRLKAAVDAVTAAGLPAPAPARQKTLALTPKDRKRLSDIGVTVDKYDDIIFFELNAGD